MIRIGILRESKIKTDNRCPITPTDAGLLIRQCGVSVYVQPSKYRCFTDKQYFDKGCIIAEDLSNCDFIFGVKEPRHGTLLEGKHYFFFGHIREDKPYEYPLLKELVEKGCTLTDYELFNSRHGRLTAFSKMAGFVGAYNAIRLYGLKNNLFEIPPAQYCEDPRKMARLVEDLRPIFAGLSSKFVITGHGEAGKGAELLLLNCLKTASSMDVFETTNTSTYYSAQTRDIIKNNDGSEYDKMHFHQHAEQYHSSFGTFANVADVWVACHSWEVGEPVVFNKAMAQDKNRRLSVISDVVADVNGSICTTLRHSSHSDPFYAVDVNTMRETYLYLNDRDIAVSAVDTLPNAIPQSASIDFSRDLEDVVIRKCLLEKDMADVDKATIIKNGVLTPVGSHLERMLHTMNI